MLRTRGFLLAFIAGMTPISAFAEPAKTEPAQTEAVAAAEPANSASPSGTTTYFGTAPSPAMKPAAAPAAVAEKPKPLPAPTLTARVDLSSQTMTVAVNGEVRYRWPISSGTASYPTPTGVFRPEWSSKMWYSRKYDLAPMPNAVFINGGVAVHGTYHTAALGSPASHGCIRLSVANSRTFYNLVQKHGEMFTRVSVSGRPNWRGGDEVASRSTSRKKTYARQDKNWFFGSGDSDDDASTAYAQPPKSARNSKYAYVYIDGVPVKVKKRKNGDYVLVQPRRPAYKTYGYAN